MTISDQRSYIKIETLHGKNPTEIQSALSEVCGEFTVGRRTVSHWVNRFRGGCVSIDNDSRPGRTSTSTDERSVNLLADFLEEDRRVTCEELFKATGAKTTQENHKNRPQLLVVRPLILHENARPHIADDVTKNLRDYGWEALPHAPFSPDMSSPDLDLFPKLEQPMRGRRFSSLEEFSTDATHRGKFSEFPGQNYFLPLTARIDD